MFRYFKKAGLVDHFFSFSHLPVQLLASFVKRLSRLSLFASPPAIVMIIPFTYNILKRHPALMTLIHQERIDGFQGVYAGWEIVTFRLKFMQIPSIRRSPTPY